MKADPVTHKDKNMVFARIWAYSVESRSRPRFEGVYGPDGEWAALFRRGDGYLGTELLSDESDVHRYLTIDYWVSKEAWIAFRDRFSEAYQDMDRRCDTLIAGETHVGDFLCRGFPTKPGIDSAATSHENTVQPNRKGHA